MEIKEFICKIKRKIQKNKEKVKKINKKDCNIVVFQSKIKR